MAVTFVDRVVLHLARRGGRARRRLRQAREVQAARRPRRRQRRPGRLGHPRVDPQSTTLLDYHHTRTARPPTASPVPATSATAPTATTSCCPCRRAPSSRTATARCIVDLVGMGTEHVIAAGGRGGLGNKALASARRKAPGFALLGEPGEDDRRRARAEVARRRRPDRLPERGQVLARLGALRGQAQDRRLPLHDARAQPRGRDGRVEPVHRRRRARAHPGRPRGQGPGPGVPAPRRALLGARPRHRLRDPRAGS